MRGEPRGDGSQRRHRSGAAPTGSHHGAESARELHISENSSEMLVKVARSDLWEMAKKKMVFNIGVFGVVLYESFKVSSSNKVLSELFSFELVSSNFLAKLDKTCAALFFN